MGRNWWVVAVALSATQVLMHLPAPGPAEESEEDESDEEEGDDGAQRRGDSSESDDSEAECSDWD